MATSNSYYSGDLVGINQGRTADRAVDAQDAASWRAYLASLADTRNRSQLGNRQIDVNDRLGTRSLDLQGELGRGEIGVRKFGIEEGSRVGMDRNEIERERLKAEATAEAARTLMLGTYYARGGGQPWQLQDRALERAEERKFLHAQAVTAAQIANATTAEGIRKIDVPWSVDSWNPEKQATIFAADRRNRDTILADSLKGLGEAGSYIEYDDKLGWVPSRRLFGDTAGSPAPGPTLTVPVPSSATNTPLVTPLPVNGPVLNPTSWNTQSLSLPNSTPVSQSELWRRFLNTQAK